MASTYLSRTFTAGNRKTFTISAWVKLANSSISTGTYECITAATSGDDGIFLNDANKLNIFLAGATLLGSSVLRDVNGWYHIVTTVDTTQATASDRVKVYINGIQETLTGTQPTQNNDSLFNNSGGTNTIGRRGSSAEYYWSGSMANYHFTDGTAYDADTFGETDSTTGIWKPKTAPSVTYGTNGFFLKFENSASMGTDSSGQSNNFTVNGSMTQLIDTPSNVFATFNPLSPSGSTYSNGNNNCTTVSGLYASRPTTSTLGVSSGKYYAEIKVLAPNTGNPEYSKIGITGRPLEAVTGSEQYQHLGSKTYDYAYNSYNGNIMNNTGSSNNGTAYGNTYTTNDIIGIALDLDNNKLYFSKNGTWQNSGDPTSGATGTGAVSIVDSASTSLGLYFFGVDAYHYTPQYNFSVNFGNGFFGTTAVSSAQNPDDGIGIFEYDVPTGYRALCTKSINAEEYS